MSKYLTILSNTRAHRVISVNQAIRWRLFILLAITAISISRTPFLFWNPRFWAEEGSVYFSAAFHSAWYEALLAPHQGYYSLFPNLMTLVASRFVQLEYAPLVTVVAAFAIQILPYLVILFRLKDSIQPIQQVLLCAITMFVANTGEVWMNTITTQFHLAIVSFFLLLANHQQVNPRWLFFDRVLLAVSGLTGLITCFLLPAFVLRWFYERSRNLLILVIILFLACIIQLSYILFFSDNLSNRFSFPDWLALIETWSLQFLLWPILGAKSLEMLGPLSAKGIVAFFILVIIFSSLFLSNRRKSLIIIVCFISVTVLSLVGSLRMGGGWRYAYAPSVILLSLFVINISDSKIKFYRILSLLIILLSLSLWIPAYRSSLSPWVVANGPVWIEEVHLWHENPDRPLQIYPQWEKKSWNVSLRVR